MTPLDFLCQGPPDGGNFEHAWADTYLSAHLISDVGKRRERNEDSCLMGAPRDIDLLDGCGFVFAVADGMGGASAGEQASRLALTTFSEAFYRGAPTNLPERMRSSIEDANAKVYEASASDLELQGMGTTLTALSIVGDAAYVGQVGDSRVYLQRPDAPLMQVTEDHSLVAEQVRAGLITAEEARNHTMKNLITRAVGIKQEVEVDLFGVRLQKGDTLLLCSDGLCNFVSDADIANALQLKTLRSAARLLIGKALEAGGNDNVSVAVVRVVDSPPRRALQEGCTPVETPQAGFVSKLRRLLG
jgi:protein phosphatase